MTATDDTDIEARIMKRNTELLLAIADRIEAEPYLYDQSTWSTETECGTSHCVAGWAVNLDPKAKEKLDTWTAQYGDPSSYNPDAPSSFGFSEHGQEALGISPGEENYLFGRGWKPREGMTVPEALRQLAAGTKLPEVTDGVDWAGHLSDPDFEHSTI